MSTENQSNRASEAFLKKLKRISKLRPNKFKELKSTFDKIKDLNDVKRNYGVSVIIKLNANVLRLKNRPTRSQVTDINDMMLYNHSTLSLEEFHYALQHARWRTFDRKVDHFGHFDATYVADVILAYKEWINRRKKT
ncbi:hypothetical protein [Nonlabens ponticola]|uniref:Uncharacterized protein n=1 Tax=Nonlabens ponticola TaxID=2496866 RepID=A0A3S9N0D3_9FLAO|nr:hypothetical protein [Nonlabens ponticola]AZQ44848.1 hypothetical protein EJ995_11640 [Nonlabens ponticola]